MWFLTNFIVFILLNLMLNTSNLMNYIFLLLWIILICKFFSTSSHLLLILLILEFFMMLTTLILILSRFSFSSNFELFLMFFTMAVCEASLGLGLLIQFSRKSGSGLLNYLFFFKLF